MNNHEKSIQIYCKTYFRLNGNLERKMQVLVSNLYYKKQSYNEINFTRNIKHLRESTGIHFRNNTQWLEWISQNVDGFVLQSVFLNKSRHNLSRVGILRQFSLIALQLLRVIFSKMNFSLQNRLNARLYNPKVWFCLNMGFVDQ